MWEWYPSRTGNLFLGLESWQWAGLLITFVGSCLVGLAARWFLIFLSGIARRSEISAYSGRGLKRSVGFLVSVLAWSWSIQTLELPKKIDRGFDVVLFAVAMAAATWLVASLWEVLCDLYLARANHLSKRTETLVLPFVRKFTQAAIFVLGGVMILAGLGYNVGALLAGLGLGGIALALAAKDSVENVFGSLTVVLDMPFGLGDWIKVSGVEGVVEEINLRSTRIRTFEDSLITLPNSNLIKASVENLGKRRYRRWKALFPLEHGATKEQLLGFSEAVRELIEKHPRAKPTDNQAFLNDITDRGVEVLVIAYLDCQTLSEELAVRQELVLGILEEANLRGIVFAKPERR